MVWRVFPTWAAFLGRLRPGRPQGKRAPRRRCSAANAGLDTPTAASPTNIGIGNHAEPPRFSFMTIRIGTSERDGTFYSQARALKTLFERRPALAAGEVMESQAASTGNANRLPAGEIEVGVIGSNRIGRGKNGETPFEQPIELAMAAPMNAGPLFFIVRAQSPIRSFSDLRGRRIAVGLRTSGMVQHAHGLFRALGMSFSDFS